MAVKRCFALPAAPRSVATLVALGLACTACGPQAPASGPVVTVLALPPAEVGAAPAAPEPTEAPEPEPRFGHERRFLQLASPEPGGAPVRIAVRVASAWGIRARDTGGRALRPCQLSPSSPSEMMIDARRCQSDACPEHEKLLPDMVRAMLLSPSNVEEQASERLGHTMNITRLGGHLDGRSFRAFRVVHTSADRHVAVACEALLLDSALQWMTTYEEVCESIRLHPGDFRDGPGEIPPAPDGAPRSLESEAAASAAVGYLSALRTRSRSAAERFLMTSADCVASGGAQDECEEGAAQRRTGLSGALGGIPRSFVPYTANVYFAPWSSFPVATVKRRGDPCGPGYDVTLTQIGSHFAVVSPEPVPDPGLSP